MAKKILNGDKVFLPSIEEMISSEYNTIGNEKKIAKLDGTAAQWWLRTGERSGTLDYIAGSITQTGYLSVTLVTTARTYGLRPAFNLNQNDVLFASSAVGGKSDDQTVDSELVPIKAEDTSEWKLTLKDSDLDLSFNSNSEVTACTLTRKEEITFSFLSGTGSSDNRYISAILTDSNGAPVYYGRLAKEETTGPISAKLKVPDNLPNGEYTIKLFKEEYNGEKNTDYAGDFIDVRLTVVDAVAEVTVGETTANYAFLETAWNAAANSANPATVKLLKDWSADAENRFGTGSGFVKGAISVSSDKTITLDLNGKTIDRGLETEILDGSVIYNTGTLTITDSSTTDITQQGKITGGYSLNGGGGIYSAETLTISGGSITGNTASSHGGGIYNTGTLNVSGTANISGNTGGNVYLTGGKTINISALLTSSALIGISTEATPTIEAPVNITGTISNNYSSNFTSDNAAYGILYKDNKLMLASHVAEVTIKEAKTGYVTHEAAWKAAANSANPATVKLLKDWSADAENRFGTGSGFVKGAISVSSDKTITLDLNGKTIDRGLETEILDGSVIYNTGTLTITDSSTTDITQQGKITGGYSLNGGGGIYNNGTLTISGGRITGNTASTHGGGIYNNGTLNVSGTANISGNTGGNVYLGSGKVINITAPLNVGASIGVAAAAAVPVDITGENDKDYSQYFTSDDSSCVIVYQNKRLVLASAVAEVTIGEKTTKYATHEAAWKAAANSANPATVKLLKDWSADAKTNSFGTGDGFVSGRISAPSGKTITLDLNGKTIDRGLGAETGFGSVIYNEGTLTITDSSTTDVTSQGIITGGKITGSGGGIYNKGTLTISGGRITDNTANWGGGIYNYGTLTISGGSITGNTAATWGGGISNDGTLNVSGKANISGNTAGTADTTDSNVYLEIGKVITITAPLTEGASIGVTARSFPVDITGENAVDYSQYFTSDDPNYDVVYQDSKLKLVRAAERVAEVTSGGTTTKYTTHEAAWKAAANSANPATIKLLKDWSADAENRFGTGDGFSNGAISVPDGKTITLDLNGKTIDRGLKTETGNGSVIVNNGTLTITDSSTTDITQQGKIMGGYESLSGGGIFNAGGTLTISGGSITGNTAATWGGGISNDGTLNVSGKANISGNTAGTADTTDSNVYLEIGKVITITAPLTEGASIGVTAQAFLADITGENNKDYSQFFTSDDSRCDLVYQDSKLKLVEAAEKVAEVTIGGTTTKYASHEAAWNAAANSANPATVKLLKDWSADAENRFGTGDGFGNNGGIIVPFGKTITLDLNGKTIDRGLKAKIDEGSVIVNNETLTITDSSTTDITQQGKIMGGYSSSGGGINNNGTLTISGGSITGNTATFGGGGIYNDGTLTISGGSITDNTAAFDGGGIYNTGTLNVSDKANISGNTGGNVYLYNDTMINISAPLTEGASIGVTATSFHVDITGENDEDYSQFFTSDNNSYEIVYQDSKLKLVRAAEKVAEVTIGGTTTKYTTHEAAWNAAANSANPATVKLLKDWSADAENRFGTGDGFGNNGGIIVPFGKTITLDLNGKTIDRGLETETDHGSVIYNHGTLTITDSSTTDVTSQGIITGGKTTGDGGGIYNSSNGTLIVNGGTITKNTAPTFGGGIGNYGTLRINGGRITDNTADCGGGVYNTKTFTVNGGSITGNTGVYGSGINTGKTFSISGKPNITGNTNGITAGNLYLYGESKIIIYAPLTAGASIGVTAEVAKPVAITGENNEDYSQYFTSDNPAYTVEYKNGVISLILPEPETHIITASAETGGTISPEGEVSVANGASQMFTFAPDDGYEVASVLVDGEEMGVQSSYTFENVTEDHSISVQFRPIGSFIRGDLTGDGMVTIFDVMTLKLVIIAGSPDGITSCVNRADADLSGDGQYTILDLMMLKQIVIGNVPASQFNSGMSLEESIDTVIDSMTDSAPTENAPTTEIANNVVIESVTENVTNSVPTENAAVETVTVNADNSQAIIDWSEAV